MKKLRIKQIKSAIGRDETQRRTIKGLGLGKIGREVLKPDTASIRGMVTKVQHMLSVSIETGNDN